MWKLLDGLSGCETALFKHFGRYTVVHLYMGGGTTYRYRLIMRGKYRTFGQVMEHLALKLPCRMSVLVASGA